MVWIHCWVPPHGRTWQRSGHWKRAPPRVVFSSLYKFPRDHCPWLLSREAKKEGCDSPVLARLILLLRSPVSCVWRFSPALRRRAGRDQRNTRAVRDGRNEGRSLSSTLVCLPGWIARSLYLLAHHTTERPKAERKRCLSQISCLTSKSPWKAVGGPMARHPGRLASDRRLSSRRDKQENGTSMLEITPRRDRACRLARDSQGVA
jgi:hypothetical protein